MRIQFHISVPGICNILGIAAWVGVLADISSVISAYVPQVVYNMDESMAELHKYYLHYSYDTLPCMAPYNLCGMLDLKNVCLISIKSRLIPSYDRKNYSWAFVE